MCAISIKNVLFLFCYILFISEAEPDKNLLKKASFDSFMSFGGHMEAMFDGDEETCVFLLLKSAFPGIVDLHKQHKFTSITLVGRIGAAQELPSVESYEKIENITYFCETKKCHLKVPKEDLAKLNMFEVVGAAEVEACEMQVHGSEAWGSCDKLALIGILAILSPPVTMICCFICTQMND